MPFGYDDVESAFDACFYLVGPEGQLKYNKDTFTFRRSRRLPKIHSSAKIRCTRSSWTCCRFRMPARRFRWAPSVGPAGQGLPRRNPHGLKTPERGAVGH